MTKCSKKSKVLYAITGFALSLLMVLLIIPGKAVNAAVNWKEKNGTYTVAGQILSTTGKVSMADGAVKDHTLKLTVKDGTYTLTMNLTGVGSGSLYGYLKDIKYYKDGYTFENNKLSGEVDDVKVEAVQKNQDGSAFSDDLGTNYPEQVSFPVISQALTDGKMPMQISIPMMDAISAGLGTQNVFLSIDWSSVKEVPSASDNTTTKPSSGNTTKKPQTTKPVVKQLKKGSKYAVGGNVYQALSANTVSLVKAANKGSVTVPATITIAGVKATVTAIGNNAFASAKKKVTSVTIGSNVTTIGNKSFAGCSKLKKISIQSQKLKKVGTKALQGIHKKAVIKVPKKNKKAYTKLFKGKGQKKTVKIK